MAVWIALGAVFMGALIMFGAAGLAAQKKKNQDKDSGNAG